MGHSSLSREAEAIFTKCRFDSDAKIAAKSNIDTIANNKLFFILSFLLYLFFQGEAKPSMKKMAFAMLSARNHPRRYRTSLLSTQLPLKYLI
jgi:hypothetical protein